jgi:hypothetical protein
LPRSPALDVMLDDAAVPLIAHQGDRVAGQQLKLPFRCTASNGSRSPLSVILHDRSVAHDARVVDQDVDPPELRTAV